MKTYFKGLAGYILDLYKIARLDFSNPHSYTKYLLINRIRKNTGATILIEAGTFHGTTAERCSRIFERVYSIELDERLATAARQRLARRTNVRIIEGDARKVILEILADEEVSNVLVFLDGHFSGGETACGEVPEPAAEELMALSRYSHKIQAVMVDDFRNFGTESGFPAKSDLVKTAEKCFGPDVTISIFLDQLVVVPRTQQIRRG